MTMQHNDDMLINNHRRHNLMYLSCCVPPLQIYYCLN